MTPRPRRTAPSRSTALILITINLNVLDVRTEPLVALLPAAAAHDAAALLPCLAHLEPAAARLAVVLAVAPVVAAGILVGAAAEAQLREPALEARIAAPDAAALVSD